MFLWHFPSGRPDQPLAGTLARRSPDFPHAAILRRGLRPSGALGLPIIARKSKPVAEPATLGSLGDTAAGAALRAHVLAAPTVRPNRLRRPGRSPVHPGPVPAARLSDGYNKTRTWLSRRKRARPHVAWPVRAQARWHRFVPCPASPLSDRGSMPRS